jgi:starch-binding outer membrane protein, SusD/RagB family
MMNNMYTKYILSFLLIASLVTGCNKFIDTDPPKNAIDVDNVFDKNETAIAVVTALYSNLSADDYTGILYFQKGLPTISVYSGLSADELQLLSGFANIELSNYYFNKMDANAISGTQSWSKAYQQLFTVNSSIEGITVSSTLSEKVRSQLLGELYFMRAFYYFYLVNLYGDIPLVLTSDYTKTSLQPRDSKVKVYDQIKADLLLAKNMISEDYVDGTLVKSSTERVRPNKAAVAALLARVYLYLEDYSNAELESSKIIDNSDNYSLVSLDQVFLKNNKETIWALQTVGAGTSQNTGEGSLFILSEAGPDPFSRPVYINQSLIDSFEQHDQRFNKWINKVSVGAFTYYYAYKYKIGAEDVAPAEYPVVMRLAEQYLIRAEARIHQNKIADGIADLNAIRLRATDVTAPVGNQLAPLSSVLSQPAALSAVSHERQVELFTEWGHRWFDIMRSPERDAIMQKITTAKSGEWDAHDALHPIPINEIRANPNLKQNKDY